MKLLKLLVLVPMLVGIAGVSAATSDAKSSTVGASGYDLVSYQTQDKPSRGNGHNVAVHDGVTYLFATEANKKAFQTNPDKYLPAYGGYCAYGVAVGKKFVADPEVWEIVDGRLFLNLDSKIQGLWSEDTQGNISKADANWKSIQDKSPAEL